ncbi:hypothetical protein L1887_57179 [Cichorium endivia]|nr:hypothetical protein L1887_57179 [Cichorium endivia]
MARTKGITLRVRKQADPTDAAPAESEASTAAAAAPAPSARPDDPSQDGPADEEMKTAESSSTPSLSRSRSLRLSRTRSHEEAFEASASTPTRATPARRSRRQPTKQEQHDEDVVMGSPQQEGGDLGDGDEADAHQPDAEAATTQRSRSTRARAKTLPRPVPQSPSASRSKRSPRKAPRISVVGRKGSARSRNAAAEDDDGAVPSEQPDEQTEQEGVADNEEKVYMLSIDAARSAGYRDSLYFFRRNPQVFKIELLQAEKDKLIEDGRLSGQLKTRNVTMVPARNVYKLHGARFLSGGKAVIDDYYEAEARASGVKEGKTVGGMSTEEQEKRREAERERERPKKKADTFSYTTIDPQGEPVVTQFGDAGQTPWVRAGNWQSRKVALQRVDITEENWMLEMARSVRGMNTELGETRRDRMSAFPRFNRYVGLDGVAGPEEATDEVADGDAEPEDDPEAFNDLPPWERELIVATSGTDAEEENKKRKAIAQSDAETKRRRGPPIGVYEPNTHLPHFSVLTQPSHASMVKIAQRPAFINDPGRERGDRRPILGGDKLGSGAWGLASFVVESVPPADPPAYLAMPAAASEAAIHLAPRGNLGVAFSARNPSRSSACLLPVTHPRPVCLCGRAAIGSRSRDPSNRGRAACMLILQRGRGARAQVVELTDAARVTKRRAAGGLRRAPMHASHAGGPLLRQCTRRKALGP